MRIQRGIFRYLLAAILIPCMATAVLAKTDNYVVVVPVANMFSGPSDKTDVVSQAIYASNVTLLVARGEWSRIQTSDHYKGWVPSRHIRILLTGNGYAKSVPAVQVESLFANIFVEPEITKHRPVVTVPFETRLELVSDSKAKDGKP